MSRSSPSSPPPAAVPDGWAGLSRPLAVMDPPTGPAEGVVDGVGGGRVGGDDVEAANMGVGDNDLAHEEGARVGQRGPGP